MKLLVLAQTPPPVHGQSVMIKALIEGLGVHKDFELHHVNLALSRDTSDIGRWRPGKLLGILRACREARRLRRIHGPMTLYYVPAPPKRGALYRDWLVMLLCRRHFENLVLHWHAAGLGEWLHNHACGLERNITQRLLGRANLSIVLGENLRADAAMLSPKNTCVVRNGIADPCPGFVRPCRLAGDPHTAVFLGMGILEKGILDAIEGVRLANTSTARWHLVLGGDIPDPNFARKIFALTRESGGTIRHVGFVSGEAKHALLAHADALIFPTFYAAETQGLVVAEALAYDLPVILTNWRAVAENLPPKHAYVVPPHDPTEIASALQQIEKNLPPNGELRQHFLAHYTLSQHVEALSTALKSVQ